LLIRLLFFNYNSKQGDYQRLQKIQPGLKQLTLELDKASAQLQKDTQARVAATFLQTLTIQRFMV
jgi:hypothetical protein